MTLTAAYRLTVLLNNLDSTLNGSGLSVGRRMVKKYSVLLLETRLLIVAGNICNEGVAAFIEIFQIILIWHSRIQIN